MPFLAHPLAYIVGVTLLSIAVIGGYALWHNKVYSNGYKAAIADVATQNKGAKDAVRKATKNVSDCYAANGNWSVSDGLCLE